MPVPKSSKWKIVRHHASSSEADKEEPCVIERVMESRKRDDPCLLEELQVREVIWAKLSKISSRWPATVIDPSDDAPEALLNASMCTQCNLCDGCVIHSKCMYLYKYATHDIVPSNVAYNLKVYMLYNYLLY